MILSPFDPHDDYNSKLFPRGLVGHLFFRRQTLVVGPPTGRLQFYRWRVQAAGWGPTPKPFPYVMRFQPERIADRHEGEEPARVIAEKPLLSLTRALNKPLLRLKLFMKAEKSIFEHSVHQRPFRAYGSEFDRELKNSSGRTLT